MLTTLLDHLRDIEGLTGTKASCREGGCGACAVQVVRAGGGPGTGSINACLCPLASLEGASVTTVEGVGSSKTGLHPIQERLAAANGSQCGFCTPGMVMAAYSLVQSLDGPPTHADIEHALDGNLCRCTGYRAILSAFGTLADGNEPVDRVDQLAPSDGDTAGPQHFVAPAGSSWYAPTLLSELTAVVAGLPSLDGVRFVGGNTSRGVYHDIDDASVVYIYLRRIADLSAVGGSDAGLELGGGTTIAQLISALDAASTRSPTSFPAAVEHLRNIASTHVRNAAGWAGNLVMVRDRGFASDAATVLAGLGAELELYNAATGATSKSSVLDFVSAPPPAGELVLVTKLIIPFASKSESFHSYRTAIRPVNSHALANAAFYAKTSADGTVEAARLVFGAVGPAPAAPAAAVDALVGHRFDQGTLAAVMAAVEATIEVEPEHAYVTVDQPDGKVAYRKALLGSFVYKWFVAKATGVEQPPLHRIRPAPSGTPDYETDGAHLACTKLSAPLQATGEAVYTGDLPAGKRDLYGAFVISTRGAVMLEAVDVEAGLKLPGVVDVIVAADIPGVNDIGTVPGEDLVLYGEQVPFVGAPVAFVVAETQAAADAAARRIPVSYGSAYEPTCLTVEAAMEAGRFLPGTDGEISRGDAASALESAPRKLSGRLYAGSQIHFYMEKQTAAALVDEGDRIKLVASTQGIDYLRTRVAGVLGVSPEQIEATCRRCGGAFGGKATRPIGVTSAVAVAATKLGRNVRCTLPITTDQAMVGGRSRYVADYTVGFDDDGTIVGLTIDGVGDSGCAYDFITFMTHEYVEALDDVYFIPHAKFTVKAVNTHTAATTPVRGPAHPQATFAIESVLDIVAAETGLSPDVVRMRNMYTAQNAIAMNGMFMRGMNVDEMVAKVKADAGYDALVAEVEAYNAQSKWRKRGISVQGTKYGVAQMAASGASALVNVSGTATVTVYHAGAEIGQGINTKVAQVVAKTLGCPLAVIKVCDSSTDALPNMIVTGGSVASEACCEAARQACLDIIERTAHIKAELWRKAEDGAEPGFADIIPVAKAQHVLLSASANFVPRGRRDRGPRGRPWNTDGVQYFAFGAALSLVEVDILTGEVTILRSDVAYDCGNSLNPLIDIGQAEGAFVMGLGSYFTEDRLVTPSGGNAADGTWEYKVPSVMDAPAQFNVSILKGSDFAYNDAGGVKAVGEPPISLAMTALSAARYAVEASRVERGLPRGFDLAMPFTVDRVRTAAAVTNNDLQL
ncbi:xanthine dehydrogenase/oxidase [Thecamonas trahens ATCC 50062]|uniref:Xanthine dehydrogenase/oxidase n=1 Tax=Thecamonas trahens ATCC 50062 TaxID=461836 RepID=A0A0L0DTB7_THETB|nr:xanthine dehydrogenase/oxidase [Thecamonas trahens ATCC 50062]KNC55296.1 xanthine dehydrogenase/oxidase [Thecamonas trahens ATCC 50062]|eukprot:XP_013753116.1 xanthine dehydrogenase/oxidase [Thecamonas trahens ATCC 50062]